MNQTTLTKSKTVASIDDFKDLEEQGRLIAYDLVENARNVGDDQDIFAASEAVDEVTSKISLIASNGDQTDSQYYERVNYATKSVLRELNATLKKEENQHGSKAAFDLSDNIRELYFSSSHNITTLASPVHIIPEVALLCQNPVVQATFGSNMVMNISYGLNFSSADTAFEYGKRAAEVLHESADSLAEKLDMVAQLKTVVAESHNTSSTYTADFAEGIIMGMLQNDTRPILAYALQSLQQFVSKERNEPSLPVLRTQMGLFEHVRTDIVTEHEISRDRSLRSQVNLDVPGRPQKIAEDAFVIVDQSNTGNYVCLISKNIKLPEPSYDAYMLSLLREKILNTEKSDVTNGLLQLTLGQDQNLLNFGANCADHTPRENMAILLNDCPETLNLISSYITSFEKRNNADLNLQEERFYVMNQSIVEMFIKNPDALAIGSGGPVYEAIEEAARHWEEDPNVKNLETAANAIKSNLSRKRFHAVAYKIESEGGINIDERFNTALQAANDELEYQAHLISQSATQIKSDIIEGIERLERKVNESNPKPDILRYEQLFDRPDIFPFEARSSESDALLLRHLHNPTIRVPLEKDLGIELSSIPLRTQLHFLRALSTHDDRQFDRLHAQLEKLDPADRKLLVQCYLVAAEEPDLGKYVLTVAEGLDDFHKTRVFEAYVNLVKESDRLATSLTEASDALGIAPSILEERRIETQKRMLQRANTLFESFVEAERKDWDSLAEFFESESVEIVTFAGTFAAIKEHIRDEKGAAALEKIPGVVVSSAQLPAELTQDVKDQMHIAYKRALLAHPPELRRLAYEGFCTALDSDSPSLFHTLTFNGKLVSSLRMDPTPEGYYMASVNTSALANGFGIGTPWLKGVLDSYKDHNISLVYAEGNAQVAGLYKKLGFSLTGSIENYGESGARVYKMTNSFSMQPNFKGQFTVLEVGFNTNIKTTGDKVLKDVIAGLNEIDLKSGPTVGINGRCSLLAAAAISEELNKRFDTVAFWNPDHSTYVVGISNNPDIPPGSFIDTNGAIALPKTDKGDSYFINWENNSPDDTTVLRIGFNPERNAKPDQEVVDALAALDNTELSSGTLVKLNGRASLPIIAALTHRLFSNYSAIAVYDPNIPGEDKYVVTHSRNDLYTLGQRIT